MGARWNCTVNFLRRKFARNVAARGNQTITAYMSQIRTGDVQIIACAVLQITRPIFYLTTVVFTFLPLLRHAFG